MSKNIIVFGANGMLGNYVSNYLNKQNYIIHKITRNEYDLNNLNIDTLELLLKNLNINDNFVIINCAGIIPQSSNKNFLNDSIYYKINSLFPVILSMLSYKYNCKFIHITTDCVYNGNKGNYNENDIPDEKNSYGQSKYLGELSKGTIIRTSIIGEEIYNKVSLLEWIIKNKNGNINGYNNHYWNGVTCLELSKIIYKIINENLYWEGVKHIFSNIVTKYELSKLINDIYELNININKYETEKNVNKTIDTLYVENSLFNIKNLKEQIIELKNYNF